MKLISLALASALLSGCVAIPEFQAAVAVKGAAVEDNLLKSAIWVMCDKGSSGAIRRRFKTTKEKAAREVICGT